MLKHDEHTKVLFMYTRRQQGVSPGEVCGLQYRHAKKLVDAGVAAWVKPNDGGYAPSEKPHCALIRTKSVKDRDGEITKKGFYSDGGPLSLVAATKAVSAPTKDKSVRSAPSTK